MVPPIYLVPTVLRHVIQCIAIGALILPDKRSAPFWPLLFAKDSLSANLVTDILDLSANHNSFVHGRNKTSLFCSRRFKSNLLAVRLAPMCSDFIIQEVYMQTCYQCIKDVTEFMNHEFE